MAYVDGRTYTAHHHHHHHHRLQQRPNTVRQPKNNNNNKSHTKTEKMKRRIQKNITFIAHRKRIYNLSHNVMGLFLSVFVLLSYSSLMTMSAKRYAQFVRSCSLSLSFSLALCILLLVGLRFIFHNLSPIEIGLSFATPH